MYEMGGRIKCIVLIAGGIRFPHNKIGDARKDNININVS